MCLDSWAVSFKHKDAYADLSSFAMIRWRTKQAGFHTLRIILKLSDGRWVISDQFDGPSKDWRVKEFNIGVLTQLVKEGETIPGVTVKEVPDTSVRRG